MDPHFDGVIFKTHAEELRRRMNFPHPPFRLLDVRPAGEQRQGLIPGSQTTSLEALADGLPPGTSAATEFIVVGSDVVDSMVRQISRRLKDLGAHRVVELAGGAKQWLDLGYDVE